MVKELINIKERLGCLLKYLLEILEVKRLLLFIKLPSG